MSSSDERLVEEYLLKNPDASPPELAGAIGVSPTRAAELLDEAVPEQPGTDESKPPSPSEHYERLDELYSELGEIDGCHCVGNRDFYGWYHTRTGPGSWDGEGRAWALGREFPGIRQELERVVYATVNYAPADWYMDGWQSFDYSDGGGKDWQDGESPTPGYGDLQMYAPFADIDLEDDVKQDRPQGDIPQDTIETALESYIEAFAELAGAREHVFVLDSVGGAYAFVAPTATAPIGEAFARDARSLIFEDMTDRVNQWLGEVKDHVTGEVPDTVGVFEPDLVNNKNRLYKAPMSIHSSLEGVVTPVDVEDPTYDYTPLSTVDSQMVSEAEDWAARFTADHSEAIESIVATLWPEHYEETGEWRSALSARIREMRRAREKTEERQQESLLDADLPDDIEATDEIEVVNAKIEAIDVTDVARDIADRWDTAPGRDPKRFDPPWRDSKTGTSCYADSDKYVDLSEGKGGGGALKLVARARGIIKDSRKTPKGDDYWKAVNELRKLGYDIPYFTGKRGTHADGLQLFDDPEDEDEARRQALRALRASRRS